MFVGYEPGTSQYFKNINEECNVEIPCDDLIAFKRYPKHNWVYNKLKICETQNIKAYPHGVFPDITPVFSKPIYNLYGLSLNSEIIYYFNIDDHYKPGHFWMPILTGPHLTTDFAVINGKSHWHHTMIGYPHPQGNFKRFETNNEDFNKTIESHKKWIKKHLKGYTGIVNIESLGSNIIECHLRMSPQYIDLYGDGWINKVIDLYEKGKWTKHISPKTGYSLVYYGNQPGVYQVNNDKLQELEDSVSSIQLTFYKSIPVETQQENNSGHYRLAIVNTFNYDAGFEVLSKLNQAIYLD